MKLILTAISVLAMLHACAPNVAKQPVFTLSVSEAEQTCRVSMQGQQFEIPADQLRLKTALRVLAERRAAALVEPRGKDVGYRCLASIIVIAQEAGIVGVGFVAEPPPMKSDED
jgi:ABC-type uncharacterized transport system auxiliary subunit